MKLNYSQKILTASVVIFFSVLNFDAIFTNLLISKIYDINDKVSQLNTSSFERERELNLRDSVASTKLDREKLSGYFVSAGNLETLEFTKYLEDLARENQVKQTKVLSLEPLRGMESSSVVSTIRYKFNVSGSWSGVYSFLQAVELLPRVAVLNSVSLRKDSDSKLWSADLDFSVVNLKK